MWSGVWGFLIGAALSFHNRNLIIGQAVEFVNEWGDSRFSSKRGREFQQQRLLESKNRVDESEFTVVIKQDIVAILSYVGHKDIVVAERISSIRAQSKAAKMFRNLIVIWANICANRFLPKDKTRLMAILPYAKEFKSAISARLAWRIGSGGNVPVSPPRSSAHVRASTPTLPISDTAHLQMDGIE